MVAALDGSHRIPALVVGDHEDEMSIMTRTILIQQDGISPKMTGHLPVIGQGILGFSLNYYPNQHAVASRLARGEERFHPVVEVVVETLAHCGERLAFVAIVVGDVFFLGIHLLGKRALEIDQ